METEINYSNISYNPSRNYETDARRYRARMQSGEGYGTGAADYRTIKMY